MNELEQPRSRAALPVISIITFLGFLDTHLLIPVMALYASELGAGVSITGFIIALYSITNTPANILFGRLIDRVGYKLPLIAGLIGDALSMFLYSVCRLPIHLALVRTFHGISGGLIGPATMSATADFSTTADKGKAMGTYGMSIAAATLVGYGLGGIFASRLGYQPLFLLGMVMLAIGAVISLSLPRGSGQVNLTTKTSAGGGFKKIKDLLGRKGLTVAYCSIFAQYFTFGGVVVKLGTSLLTGGTDHLEEDIMSQLVAQLAKLHQQGLEMLIVSSGAIASGRHKLGLTKQLKRNSFRLLSQP